MIWTKETLLQALEHAPEGKIVVPDLLGWSCDEVNICNLCTARLLGRGFSLGSDAHSIWVDSDVRVYVCSGCKKKFSGKGRNHLTPGTVSE